MAISELVIGGQNTTCMGYEAITVSDTAIGFTAGTITPTDGSNPAIVAVLIVEDDQVRFTYDGSTTPTDAIGQLLDPGDRIVIQGVKNISNFRMIRVTGDASVKCSYERFI